MAMAAPRNSAASYVRTFSPKSPGTVISHGVSSAPSANGTSSPDSDTAVALLA